MPVFLHLHLYRQPGWELGDTFITPLQLRDLATKLGARLNQTADILEKLLALGWELQPDGTYQVHLTKDLELAEASQELEAAGLPFLIPMLAYRYDDPLAPQR